MHVSHGCYTNRPALPPQSQVGFYRYFCEGLQLSFVSFFSYLHNTLIDELISGTIKRLIQSAKMLTLITSCEIRGSSDLLYWTRLEIILRVRRQPNRTKCFNIDICQKNTIYAWVEAARERKKTLNIFMNHNLYSHP